MILTDDAFEKQLISIRNSTPGTEMLDFSFIELTSERLANLLDALRSNTRAHTLNLSTIYLRERIGFAETASINSTQDTYLCSQVVDYISTHHQIEQLSLSGNQLSNAEIICVLQAMCANRSIRILELHDNDFTDDIIPYVKELVDINPILELINLSFNKFSDGGIQQLLGFASPYCAISCKRTSTSQKLTPRVSQKSKIDVGFKYIYIDRHKPLSKQQAKSRFNMRERLNKLTGYEPDICERIYAAYMAAQEIYPEVLTLFDAFKVIEQTHARNENFPCKSIIIQFTVFCLQQEDAEFALLTNILSAPGTNLRSQILHAIGNHYFTQSAGIQAIVEDGDLYMPNHEIEVIKQQRLLYLVIAYVAFSNIEDHDDNIEFLKYIICRTIISGEHRFGIERPTPEIMAKYSNLSSTPLFYKLSTLKCMEDIQSMATELPSILTQHKMQACAQEELLVKTQVETQSTLSLRL